MNKIKHTVLAINSRKMLLGLILPMVMVALFFANSARARTVNRSAEKPVAIVPAAAAVSVAAAPMMAPVTVNVDLCATTGSVTLPGPTVVPVWGYVLGDCTGGEAGNAIIPGPVLEINAGDTLNVTLYNGLVAQNVSLIFSGQTTPPDYVGIAPGGSATYSTTPADPGTFMYESSINAAIQTSMGLYGAFVVNSTTPDQAYADVSTAYDREEVLVLSEIDTALHSSPGAFDLLDYHPTYWLINGKAHPDTDLITGAPGERVLLRYINAGGENQTMSLVGAQQTVIAQDGYPLNYAYDLSTTILASGQSTDVIVDIPILAGGQRFPLYNRHMRITNNGDFAGGMMTFIDVLPVLDFNSYTIDSYGGSQDIVDTTTVEDGGATLRIVGNSWKRIDFPYTLTPHTVIEFDFMSGTQGEVHGIGFDTDDTINNPIQVFQLYGTQPWGINHYQDYAADAPNWKHYKIFAGQFYTGAMDYLTFAMDDDASAAGESAFRNIRVYEQPLLLVDGNDYLVESYGGGQNSPGSAIATIENDGTTLRIVGNGWRKVAVPYNVTASTVLEFDFSSSAEGEIHAIGLDDDDAISASRTFELYGTQLWGDQTYNTYTNGDGTVHYSIPVGTHFTGSMLYITFAMDDDAAAAGESVFSDISLHD
ncbi:MAG: multicopper oxidase domain-containing protein [Chloroflexi bacterium]|nr:multicopper oxidase domain-containing protein [Chloroflexota bacterium]